MDRSVKPNSNSSIYKHLTPYGVKTVNFSRTKRR